MSPGCQHLTWNRPNQFQVKPACAVIPALSVTAGAQRWWRWLDRGRGADWRRTLAPQFGGALAPHISLPEAHTALQCTCTYMNQQSHHGARSQCPRSPVAARRPRQHCQRRLQGLLPCTAITSVPLSSSCPPAAPTRACQTPWRQSPPFIARRDALSDRWPFHGFAPRAVGAVRRTCALPGRRAGQQLTVRPPSAS